MHKMGQERLFLSFLSPPIKIHNSGIKASICLSTSHSTIIESVGSIVVLGSLDDRPKTAGRRLDSLSMAPQDHVIASARS